MVQVRESSYFCEFTHDDYWKLPNTSDWSLQNLELYAKRSLRWKVSKERQQDLFQRQARGLLAYEMCSGAELFKFFKERKLIRRGGSSRLSTPALIAVLEDADDAQTFDRFLNLPAELRQAVYTIHFAWLMGEPNASGLMSPSPPPITNVNRLIRKESLRAFYQSCTVMLNIAQSLSYYGIPRVHLDLQTAKFFLKAPAEVVGMLRHVRIICDLWDEEEECYFTAEMLLDMGVGDVPATIEMAQHGPGEETRNAAGRLELRAQRWLRAISERDRRTKLQGADIKAFFKLAQAEVCESAEVDLLSR